MNVVSLMGIISGVAFLIPVMLIIAYRLFINYSLLALLFYYFFTGLHNLFTLYSAGFKAEWLRYFGIVLNYLDTPLMLVVLLFFCPSPQKKKIVVISIVSFLVFEIVVSLFTGFHSSSLVYILGPGIALIFVYSLYLFTYYVKLSIEKNKGFAKGVMITSIVFVYGCYATVYVFHYVQQTPAVEGVFIIYYIASFLSAILMCTGLYYFNKRSKEIKEVQQARKELQAFFDL